MDYVTGSFEKDRALRDFGDALEEMYDHDVKVEDLAVFSSGGDDLLRYAYQLVRGVFELRQFQTRY